MLNEMLVLIIGLVLGFLLNIPAGIISSLLLTRTQKRLEAVGDWWAQRTRKAAEERLAKLQLHLGFAQDLSDRPNRRTTLMLEHIGQILIIGILTIISLLYIIIVLMIVQFGFPPLSPVPYGTQVVGTVLTVCFTGVMYRMGYQYGSFAKHAFAPGSVPILEARIAKLREKLHSAPPPV